MVALRLFAQQGVEAVSLRTINTEAGSKNKSAVQYHFGSKLGILEAIFEKIGERLLPIYDDLFARLKKLSRNNEVTVSEIILSLHLPIFYVDSSKDLGPYMSKLLAKMMLNSTPEYQALFQGLFQPQMEATVKLLHKQLPHKSKHYLKFQLSHGLMATITGSATKGLVSHSLLGDLKFKNEKEMLMVYIDYVVGGLTNESPSFKDIDVAFWSEYFASVDKQP